MFKKIAFATSLFSIAAISYVNAGTATATVSYTVNDIDTITVSGNPGAFTVSGPTSGGTSVQTDATTTYSVTTNNAGRKVAATVDSALPAGIQLAVNLTAPTGATSAGYKTLTTTSQDLVTGIADLHETNTITYRLTVDLAVADPVTESKTVTYTFGV